MGYQVQLQRKDGPVTQNFKMYNALTPSPGDIIDVDTDHGRVKARVTTSISAQPIDLVTAVEVEGSG
jgi:hypothetical protein